MTEEISQVLEDAKKRTNRNRVWRNLGVLVGVTLIVLVVGRYFRTDHTAITYTTDAVTRGDLTVTITATGSLRPVNQVEVGTEVSGTIESVNADFNDRITAGQILAELDTDQLEAGFRQSSAALALAEARVVEAQATLTETSNRLRRVQDLIAKKLSSQEELDRATAAAARAEAGLAVAQAEVAQAQARQDSDRRALEKAIIRSPIDGIVLERRVEPGQTVAAALQTPVLFRLAEDLGHMELHIDVDEADVGLVAIGQPAVFSVDAYPDRTFPAKIEEVRFAPEVVAGVVTYKTILAVDNESLLLRPGMTATAEITVTRLQDVVLVPNTALRFKPPAATEEEESSGGGGGLVGMFLRPPTSTTKPVTRPDADGGSQVWLLEDSRPKAVTVQTGPTDGIVTQIIDGDLAPGTPVVVDAVRTGSQ
ncbi:efflux RND transporter periplasmic adaptor subunit [Thiococcus pfennigii]|uniref:efflux RND transporter periplasmic adaptor subunit n=1 Tax=Thiococcus pfennigii TaxID=1057 RepID=UPI001902F6DF|nr:efflux transporter periplasmic adaptor subunit [Thiococcus pfennigii]